MEAEKSAADLLADDPSFKDYFQAHPEQAQTSPQTEAKAAAIPLTQEPKSTTVASSSLSALENPLAEYGAPPPQVEPILDQNKKQLFRIGAIVIGVVFVLLLLFALLKLFSR